MDDNVTTVIDAALCTGCGLCVEICPLGVLSMENGKARVTGRRSIHCGHCEAVCPVQAVKVQALDDQAFAFSSFSDDDRWLPFGDFDVAMLVRLMRSRRSCRRFQDKPVPGNILEDLVRIGTTAPSGTNSQLWTFTIVPTREAVIRLGSEIAGFFKRLNRLARRTWLRRLLSWVGRRDLENYYHRYYNTISRSMAEWDETGRDRLFHHATAVILVGSKPGASTPAEDALLATENILLASHAMGLGTCLVGYAVAALRRDVGIQIRLGVPADETVYAVIALGYPNQKFQRSAGRRQATVRFL
jgi:nitroreductase/NAD-dependent dihydropyrimidine dehydrogenase PreA subunit